MSYSSSMVRRSNRRRKPAGGAQEERRLRPMSSRSYENTHEDDEQLDGTEEDDAEPSNKANSTVAVRQRQRLAMVSLVFVLLYGLLLRGVYSRYGASSQAAEEGVCTADAMRDRRTKEEEAEGTPRKENKLVQMIRKATHPLELYHYPSSSSSRIETPQAQQQQLQSTTPTATIPKKKKKEYRNIRYPLAHTTSPQLDREQLSQLQEFRDRVLAYIPDLHERASKVPWGGDARIPWWMPVLATHHHHRYHSSTDTDQSLDAMEGGRLLWYYYKIMSRYITEPGNLSSEIYFPFRLCKRQHGCAAEDAIWHTLQWRERYQPWRITPQMVRENRNGFCYQRGFSPPAVAHVAPQPQHPHRHHSHNYGRHAMVWFRLGRHHVDDGLMYFRVVLHSVDQAVASALRESNLRVGKFNVLVDGTDFEFRKVPDMAHLKHFVTIAQDHYTNRVGMIVLTNVSRTAEFVVNLVKPLLTKEVRDKIVFLSHDPDRRMAELEALVEREYIPEWLGGPDAYQFDAQEYYYDKQHFYWSDEEGRAFVETMPYHAVS